MYEREREREREREVELHDLPLQVQCDWLCCLASFLVGVKE